MNKKRKREINIPAEEIIGVPYFYESTGNWYIVRDNELPELAKEEPYITCEDIANDLNLETWEGCRVRITLEVLHKNQLKEGK